MLTNDYLQNILKPSGTYNFDHFLYLIRNLFEKGVSLASLAVLWDNRLVLKTVDCVISKIITKMMKTNFFI